MTAPYDQAARGYLRDGWWPIPVLGKTKPVAGATGYQGTITAEHIETWLDFDTGTREFLGRFTGYDNLGLRHQGTIAIDVDAGYGDKDGVTQLAAFATEHQLPPLPATWSSTARGADTGSRQYFYRLAEDVKFKTKPCPSVELCCWHHRYSVVAPSIHPDTGSVYTWYEPGQAGSPPPWGPASARGPRVEELPELPVAWLVALRGGVADADPNAVVVELPDLLAAFPAGEPDRVVTYHLTKWAADADPVLHVGHDEAKNMLITAVMLGREGHPGAERLIRLIVDRLAAYLATARPATAQVELNSLVAACVAIGQQKPIRSDTFGLIPLQQQVVAAPEPAPEPERPSWYATTEEVETFLATYTRHGRPDRLGRRIAWMRADNPASFGYHAQCLVEDAIAGHYPATRARAAIIRGWTHHAGRAPDNPNDLLARALGTVLARKVAS